jgi:phage/plasmid-associated DNA primase
VTSSAFQFVQCFLNVNELDEVIECVDDNPHPDDWDRDADYDMPKPAPTSYQKRQQKAQEKALEALDTLDLQIRKQAPIPERTPKETDLKSGTDPEIADRVIADFKQKDMPFAEDEFWKFDGACWAVIPNEAIVKAILRYNTAWYWPGGMVRLNKARIASIEYLMQKRCALPDFFAVAPIGANFKDCFLALDSKGEKLETADHHPLQRQRYVLSVNMPKDTPFSLDELRERQYLGALVNGSFPRKEDPYADEKLDVIGEAIGSALFGLGTRMAEPQAIIFQGPSAGNGKSQVLALARGILPPEVVSSVSPDQFDDKNCLVDLAGKQLNTSDELGNAKAISSDKFKNVTTGGQQTTRKIYRPVMQFRPIAQHIFACNELPSFTGGFDRGTHRRLLVIDFNRVIPIDDQIPMLAEKILEHEMELLLRWAIDGAKRLLANGGHFTQPRCAVEAKNEWASSADPVVGWAKDCLVANGLGLKDVNGAVPHKTSLEAFMCFEAWCAAEHLTTKLGPRSFTKRMKGLMALYGISFKESNSQRRFIGMIFKTKAARMAEAAESMDRDLDPRWAETVV